MRNPWGPRPSRAKVLETARRHTRRLVGLFYANSPKITPAQAARWGRAWLHLAQTTDLNTVNTDEYVDLLNLWADVVLLTHANP